LLKGGATFFPVWEKTGDLVPDFLERVEQQDGHVGALCWSFAQAASLARVPILPLLPDQIAHRAHIVLGVQQFRPGRFF
jgi:hypothetical protein